MVIYTPPEIPQSIPLVDLAGTFAPGSDAEAAAAWEIHKAARETGFFYVKNHGVSGDAVAAAFAATRRYFAQPLDTKLQMYLRKWPGMLRGYEPMLFQQLDDGSPRDLKEAFYAARHLDADHPLVREKLPNHGPNQWPDNLPGFREAIEAYYEPALDLGRHLMRLIALSLQLDRAFFDEAFFEPCGTLRLLHYPPHPADAAPNQLGAGAHTDYGAITLLAQDDNGGLEVENAAGQWLRADPIPGTIVINLGDMVKRWTNDLYHSNMHRVLNNRTNSDRYSLPLFFNPAFKTHVECVPTCAPAAGPPKYKPCTAGEHVAERIRQSYEKAAA